MDVRDQLAVLVQGGLLRDVGHGYGGQVALRCYLPLFAALSGANALAVELCIACYELWVAGYELSTVSTRLSTLRIYQYY